MKKIIAIILGVLMLFSMSVTSFAAFVEETTTKVVETTTAAPVKAEKLEVVVSAKIDPKAPLEKEENSLVTYEGRKCTFEITVKNDTSSSMSGAIISNFSPSFTDKKTGDALNVYTTKDSGFDKDPGKTGISSEKSATFTYIAYIATAEKVTITVHCLGASKTFEVTSKPVTFNFVWQVDEDTKEDSSVTETTTEAPSKSETTTVAPETTTKAPVADEESTEAPVTTTESAEKNELTTGDNVITTNKADDKVPSPTAPTYSDTDNDYVEPEIPDTGISAAPFGAAGALVVSSITALIAKKRKLK